MLIESFSVKYINTNRFIFPSIYFISIEKVTELEQLICFQDFEEFKYTLIFLIKLL